MNEIFEKVKKIVSEQLGVEEEIVNMESTFVDDLAADSLDIVELIMSIEEEFDIEISDEKILYHIREASRLAEVIIAKAYEKQNVPFTKEDLMEYRGNIETMRNEHWSIWKFVVIKAAYETLMNLYILMATRPEKVKELLSDLSKEVSYNLKWLKDLLDDLKDEYEEILEQFYTITDPKFALRGKLAVPVYPNQHAPYHGLNGMGGYSRSYNTTSYGGHFGFNRGGRF